MTAGNKAGGATAETVTASQRIGHSHAETSPSRHGAATITAILSELFPATFVAERWRPHKPLKVGIGNDLAARGVLLARECKVLRWYVARRMYQAALAAGGPRYDLDGNVTGEVLPEQVAGAKTALADMDRCQVELAGAANAAQAERAKLRAQRGVEKARDAVEFIAARTAARKATNALKGPAPYHKAVPEKIAARPPKRAADSLAALKTAAAARKAAQAVREGAL